MRSPYLLRLPPDVTGGFLLGFKMIKRQFILKGFPFALLEDMIFNPGKVNRLFKAKEFLVSKNPDQFRVFFIDSLDFMVYSVDVLDNEILSSCTERAYVTNPQDESSEIFCVNRTLEQMLPH